MTWDGRGHDFGLVNRSYALVEPWTKAARIHPARITYVTDPKPRAGLRLFDGVDWVRRITPADPEKPARADLTDLRRAARLPQRATRFSCAFTNAATADHLGYHGLSYATPEELRARMPDKVEDGWSADSDCTFTPTGLHPPAPRDALTGRLENVRSITLRRGLRGLDRAGVKADGPVRFRFR